MNSLNKTMTMGNLTRDPEMTVTPKGMAITKFSIACNRRYKNSNGEDEEETTFVDCTAFGRQAEVIKEHFSIGKPIFVEGRLKLDTWEDGKTGQNRSRLSVICEKFYFIGGRFDDQQRPVEAKETGDKPTGDDVPF